MLVVKTFLATSKMPNAGIGLFAAQNIESGQKVAMKDSKFQQFFTEEEFENASEEFKNFLSDYGCHRNGVWILEKDNEKYINHSRNPNLSMTGEALRDIKAGEELKYDYRQIDDRIEQNPPSWL